MKIWEKATHWKGHPSDIWRYQDTHSNYWYLTPPGVQPHIRASKTSLSWSFRRKCGWNQEYKAWSYNGPHNVLADFQKSGVQLGKIASCASLGGSFFLHQNAHYSKKKHQRNQMSKFQNKKGRKATTIFQCYKKELVKIFPWSDFLDVVMFLEKLISGWWFQPIWKILESKWGSFPQIGVKIKNIWNRHLVLFCVVFNSLGRPFPRRGSDSICHTMPTIHRRNAKCWTRGTSWNLFFLQLLFGIELWIETYHRLWKNSNLKIQSIFWVLEPWSER